MTEIHMTGVFFTWDVEPESWTVTDGTLTALAAPGTDIFSPPFLSSEQW
jgi:hypothetical protein